ncbi:hypothetical protein Ddye_026573 [Dipteronia dyeriana]|uniref:CCHC-type domain-containing protein n=1 Tax=Dipteronia dyeriana TaxID=168575 RepID=A0AAD9WQL3_9ROSI|nr:hypothetical protein Ddye_026573 [Dipteronia dyeriana]
MELASITDVVNSIRDVADSSLMKSSPLEIEFQLHHRLNRFNPNDVASGLCVQKLSLNLTLKLDHSNYIYRRTQVLTAIEAFDLECFVNGQKSALPNFITVRSARVFVNDKDMIISLLNGVGHEYDSVVTLISSQQSTMALEAARFLFLMHEQRIEHQNSVANISVTPPAQFASNRQNMSNNRRYNGNRGGFDYNNFRCNNRGKSRGGGRFGGRGNQRVYCQLCGRPGHVVLQCY